MIRAMTQVVDFSTSMSAKSTLLWRITFRHLLSCCKDNAAVESAFSRVTGQEQLHDFNTALLTFLRLVVGPWLADEGAADAEQSSLVLQRLRVAEMTLKSGEH